MIWLSWKCRYKRFLFFKVVLLIQMNFWRWLLDGVGEYIPVCINFSLSAEGISCCQFTFEWVTAYLLSVGFLFLCEIMTWLDPSCYLYPSGNHSVRFFFDESVAYKLRSGIIVSQMGTCWSRTAHIPVDHQQTEITRSLTKCRLWSSRNVSLPSEVFKIRWREAVVWYIKLKSEDLILDRVSTICVPKLLSTKQKQLV